jgi:hypothetical protein
MDIEDRNERLRLLKTLADKLGVNIEDSNHAVTTKDIGASVEKYDGSLKAVLFPNDNGSVRIEGLRLPGIDIRVVDKNNEFFSGCPENAVYLIKTYWPKEDMDYNIPGAFYIDSDGKFLAREQCVKII